jgi:hypothetical protein
MEHLHKINRRGPRDESRVSDVVTAPESVLLFGEGIIGEFIARLRAS